MPSWYSLTQNKNKDADYAAELFVYDEIGGWGVTAAQVIGQLRQVKGKILLRINTPGGSVFEAVALYNFLKSRKGGCDTIVDGWALSAGSFLMLAGEKRSMGEACMVMVHSAWGMAVGNGDDLRKQAELLDKVNDQIKTIYVNRTGQDDDTVAEWLSTTDGIWLSAAEAVELGFATETFESAKVAAHYDTAAIAAKYQAPREALCVFENEYTKDELMKIEELEAALAAAGEKITALEAEIAEEAAAATAREEALTAQLEAKTLEHGTAVLDLATAQAALSAEQATTASLQATMAAQRQSRIEAHVDHLVAAKRLNAEGRPAILAACLASADDGVAILSAIPEASGHDGHDHALPLNNTISLGSATLVISRDAFNAMSQAARREFALAGGQIVG